MKLAQIIDSVKRFGSKTPVAAEQDKVQPSAQPYIYRPEQSTSFEAGVAALRQAGRQVIEAPVDNTSAAVVPRILAAAEQAGLPFQPYQIDIAGYGQYFEQAGYRQQYAEYYRGNQPEKSLEHYVALQLLDIHSEDVFVDLASEHSPIPEIYQRLTGATSYSQDIMYAEGIQGNQIGGDACAMPVPDGFMTKATLTCSIEHFEGEADSKLFQELARVLRPGGKVCIVPFYVFTEPTTQTDPTVSVPAGVEFDAEVPLHCAQGWGNRHGRFYSPESFAQRVIAPVQEQFKFEFYYLENAAAVEPSVYARFAVLATRL